MHTHALSQNCKDSNVKMQDLEGMTCKKEVMQSFVHQQSGDWQAFGSSGLM